MVTKKKAEAGVEETNSLKEALDKLNKKYGSEAMQSLTTEARQGDSISTGSYGLDQAIGIGGVPRGRIVEIYGPESAGKTTLCLHLVANCQKAGMAAAYIDAEHAFDPVYASGLGVDLSPNKLLFNQPDYGEQGIDIAETLIESGKVGLVVFDSVSALSPKAEIDADLVNDDGKVSHGMGLQARMMSETLRRMTGKAKKNNCTVVWINQLRQKIGVFYGNPETTTGGNALKYYASVRLDIRRIGKIEDKGSVVGNRTRVKVVKNKVAAPFKEAEFDIRFGEGIDQATEMLDMAVEAGKLDMSGGRYKLDGQQVAYGREPARQWAKGEGKAILEKLLKR